MEVKCKTNDTRDIPENLRDIAFMADYNTGISDITPDKNYKVYGIKKISSLDDTWYFVITDSLRLPWWMSSHFFEIPTGDIPSSWESQKYSHEGWERDLKTGEFDVYVKDNLEIIAPPSFHEAYESGGEEKIIDSEPEGFQLFEKMQKETGY